MLPVVTGALFQSCPLIESLEQIKANPEWNSSSVKITIFLLSKDSFLVLYFGVLITKQSKLHAETPDEATITVFILSFSESPCKYNNLVLRRSQRWYQSIFFIFTESYHSALLWQPWRHHHRETIFGECHLTLFAFYCSGGTGKKRESRHSWRAWRESKRLLGKFLFKYHYDSASSLFCCLKHSCTVHPNF